MKPSFFKRNTELLSQKLKENLRSLKQWYLNTPERALLEAYQAAQSIRNIEIQHFNNKKISPKSANYTENVMSYWQGYLNKKLTIIKVKLAEFRLSRGIINISNSTLLENLKFIDEVVEKYNIKDEIISNSPVIPPSQPLKIKQTKVNNQPESSEINSVKVPVPPFTQKTGALPRSIGRTINKIKADLAPQAEEDFIRNYRISTNRTKTAVRFLILLVIVPLLTQQLSKQFLITPILDRIRGDNEIQIFLNSDMEVEALQKLKSFEEQLRFQYLLNQAPPLSSEVIKETVKNKALEIAEEFRFKSNSAISNVFADLLSLITFAVIISSSKREIVTVKLFLDNIVYGLSDSAKAFLIILFTDIFVGFHSPHGWDVILETLAKHLGLPASRNAIFLFIATFPVILNTIFKYWIFRYLSRLSPSALATLKEMDE
ncbi:proton extrusion protein PcxA [Nostoc sp. MG11]|uniref:proton extrusion protein PcxA n=1 Tax=Nostoc sp. MG11 TaxID=2721166 RepID=UPI001865C027|nr:proton extrusion protein PcxA [Nostoc sp. MG11]